MSFMGQLDTRKKKLRIFINTFGQSNILLDPIRPNLISCSIVNLQEQDSPNPLLLNYIVVLSPFIF